MSERLLIINVSVAGRPAPGAGVTLALNPKQSSGKRTLLYKATGPIGAAHFSYDDKDFVADKITVAAVNFWTVSVERPEGSIAVTLNALPKTGRLGWWHRALNITRFSRSRGRGVRIGVIDEGMGPHPALAHVRNLGCMKGVLLSLRGGEDLYGHGTHVTGIIAARPTTARAFGGIAPGAHVSAIKVRMRADSAPDGLEDAKQDSVAEALEMLVLDENVDLVNLSLVALEPSRFLAGRIKEAFEKGVLCICAAGNDGAERILFPAAYDEAIAVASIGKLNTTPLLNSPRGPERGKIGKGGLFLAPDSNYGTKIACCGPGVHIISTAPGGGYAEMSGTSMAAPAVCAALAGRLASDRIYAAMPRDAERSRYARAILEKCCADIGLSARYQGNGLIQA